MADEARTKGAFPELELDFKPSARPPAESVDDEPEQELKIELDASPSHRRAGVAELPLGLADTVAADDPAPAQIALAPHVSSMPPRQAGSLPPASGSLPPTVSSVRPRAVSSIPAAAHSVPAPTLASAAMPAPPASVAPLRRDAHVAVEASLEAPPEPPRPPARPPAEIARELLTKATQTVAGAGMIGAAILLTLLDIVYVRAENAHFPIPLTWLSLPLALAGGGVLAYRMLRAHAS
ncbi:MAG TPA: hypothetical protein VGM56_31225 [Byssovorax sp.]|jgi:hypothetical protein